MLSAVEKLEKSSIIGVGRARERGCDTRSSGDWDWTTLPSGPW